MRSGWTHGPGSGVECSRSGSKHEGCCRTGCRVVTERLGADCRSCILVEQAADVAATKGKVAGPQAADVRRAQGREQQEEAGEMAGAQTHRLYVKRFADVIGRQIEIGCCFGQKQWCAANVVKVGACGYLR